MCKYASTFIIDGIDIKNFTAIMIVMIRKLLFILILLLLLTACSAKDFSIEFNRFCKQFPELKLTSEEFVAISKYKNMHYTDVNYFLRSGKAYCNNPTEMKKTISLINSGLKKLPLFTGTTYRGCSFEENPDLFKRFTTVGGTYSDKTYISTSVDRRVAESFLTDNGDSSFVIFRIRSSRGRILRGIGSSGIDQFEREVLLPPGCSFDIKIVKIEKITYEDYGLSSTPVTIVDVSDKE